MERIKAYDFMERNKDFLFPNKKYSDAEVETALLSAPNQFENVMNGIPFRKPSTVQLIAFFPGSLGVDRFYLHDIKMGILKYFTFGGAGVWWIIDILNAKDRCRAYNCEKLLLAINDPSVVDQMHRTDANIQKAKQIGAAAFDVGKTVIKGAKDIRDTNFINK